MKDLFEGFDLQLANSMSLRAVTRQNHPEGRVAEDKFVGVRR